MRIRHPFQGKEQAEALAYWRRQRHLALARAREAADRRGPETDEQTDTRLDAEADRYEEND